MTLIRAYRPQTKIDHDDLDGLLYVLDREIQQHGENGEADTAYYVGASLALQIIRNYGFVDTQKDFMELFVHLLNELQGIEEKE